MMALQFDTESMVNHLNEIVEDFNESSEHGFAQSGNLIVDLFRNQWLSGRTSGDLGLNIQTGNLYQSIRSNTTVNSDSLISEIFNRGATYWEYHQTGTDRLPKRLYLNETFDNDGRKIYTDEIESVLAGLQ